MLVVCSGTSGRRLASRTSARPSSCSTRATSPSVSTPRSTPRWRLVSSRSGGCARATRAGSRSTSTSLLLPMPRSHALILIALLCSYIVAAALDGGTQVISFILNFAVFGASGTAHNFPEWWGNGTSHLPPRSSTDITDCLPLPCALPPYRFQPVGRPLRAARELDLGLVLSASHALFSDTHCTVA